MNGESVLERLSGAGLLWWCARGRYVLCDGEGGLDLVGDVPRGGFGMDACSFNHAL